MARIYRDDVGVPHVRADAVLDLAHAQGEVTARDRTWQLEHQRRRATGTTAEVLGRAGLPWDRFSRRTRIADTARHGYAALEPESRAFVAAYVDGVNAGLHDDVPELTRLGIAPRAWEPWTPLAVFLGQHLLFASLPGKLWAHRAQEVLGPDAALLTHEGPITSGSNAWVVGGGRTASGFPLIGGDPHRAFESPGVYQQIRLSCGEFDVAGLSFPGVPGVQHFAHAGDVAWAITNAAADYQDVYAERLRRVASPTGSPTDGAVEALGPSGWEPAEERVEQITVRGDGQHPVSVVTTARGPLFSGEVDDGAGLSVRTTSWALGDLGFDALLPLLRARTVADVDAALDRWVEPVNNVVIADRHGAVRYRVAGRVPQRSEANRRGIVDATDPSTAWTGWLPSLPRDDVAADGCAVTANERRGPESDPIGTTFARPHRARRIRALLGERRGLTTDDFAAIHGDTLLPILELVRDLLGQQASGPVRDEILAWDGRMDADSRGAAAFAAWRAAVVRRIAAEPVLAPLHEPILDDPVLLPWLDLTARVGSSFESLMTHGSPFGIDLTAISAAALRDAEGHPATWGETHLLDAAHAFDALGDPSDPTAPRLPAPGVSGDLDCVRCTGSVPGVDDAAWRGSVARYVWDLAPDGASGWVVPFGSSADPRSPHHLDQLPAWVDARLAPLTTDWAQLFLEDEA